MAIRNYKASAEEIAQARIGALIKSSKEILEKLETLFKGKKIKPKVFQEKKKHLESAMFNLDLMRPSINTRESMKLELDYYNKGISGIRRFCDEIEDSLKN